MSETYDFPQTVPQLVEEPTLKKAKVVLANGDVAVRMTGDIVIDPEVSLVPVTDALGETTDTSSDNTVIGLLKNIASSGGSSTDVSNIEEVLGTKTDVVADGTISGLTSGVYDKLNYIKPNVDSIALGVGESTDADTDNSVIGLLKNIKSTNTQNLSGITTPLGTTSDTSSDNTVIGLLKSINTSGGGPSITPITDALGTTSDSPYTTTVIGRLKTIAQGTDYLSGINSYVRDTKTAVGTTSDTTSDNTVIGLLKRMNSRF